MADDIITVSLVMVRLVLFVNRLAAASVAGYLVSLHFEIPLFDGLHIISFFLCSVQKIFSVRYAADSVKYERCPTAVEIVSGVDVVFNLDLFVKSDAVQRLYQLFIPSGEPNGD